jgi:hypothetical protein
VRSFPLLSLDPTIDWAQLLKELAKQAALTPATVEN